MNTNHISLLIIEDHVISAQAYAGIIKGISNTLFKISFAYNCDDALVQFNSNVWDLVLLDLRIPASTDLRFNSGEDLAGYFRIINPDTKVIILTTITDWLVAVNIFREFNPEGFLIKSDIDGKTLMTAVRQVLQGDRFYSNTVQNYISDDRYKKLGLDNLDRQILYWFSMGLKIGEISNHVPLSKRAIEVRKRKLIDILVADDQSSNLIMAAKRMRII